MLDFLDDDDGDLHLDSTQDIAVATGASEVVQAGATVLRAQEGEYFLDGGFGADHLGKVLTKPFRPASAGSHYRRKLLEVNELTAVRTVTDLAAGDDLAVTGRFEVQTPYGVGEISL